MIRQFYFQVYSVVQRTAKYIICLLKLRDRPTVKFNNTINNTVQNKQYDPYSIAFYNSFRSSFDHRKCKIYYTCVTFIDWPSCQN